MQPPGARDERTDRPRRYTRSRGLRLSDTGEDTLRERLVGALGDHYELDREIGRGGMSVVYRARDRRLNRAVAIKVLPPELAFDPAVRTRFTREAQMSAQLSHPHIVPIHDVGEREGIAWLVMPFVSGGSLATLLAHEPKQPIEEVLRLARETADALAYAHQRGVVHRDIKPDNILLDGESGRAMVTDFGIARAVEAGTRLTVTGIAVGTPTYMSPEQATGEREIDGRSDIYSLGVVAYQMLTGRTPFTAGNSLALLMKHVSEPPRPIAELRPDAPKGLRDAIERALAKSPEDRWPTAGVMRDALAGSDAPVPGWRLERREPVRYSSPRPDPVRHDRAEPRESREPRDREQGASRERSESRPFLAPRGPDTRDEKRSRDPRPTPTPTPVAGANVVLGARGPIVLEPAHLAHLTTAQRAELRLWRGRVALLDRLKFVRRFAIATALSYPAGIAGFIVGVNELPPLIVAPVVTVLMTVRLRKLRRSLRESGLRLRDAVFAWRARRVLPAPPPVPTESELEKLAPREVLDGAHGSLVRRAAHDRAAILEVYAGLSKPDRELIPDVVPTVNGLVDRVAHLAQMLHRLDQSVDTRLLGELDARIAEAEKDATSTDGERRLALYKRQRATLGELGERRAALARQLESAGLALGNIRLDLIKLRSSGLQSALSDVSTATQEARALSKEIGAALEAAAEVRSI